MLVRLKCSMVRGRVTLHEGDTVEADDARAARLVAAGLAEAVPQRVDEPAAAVVAETAAVAIPATATDRRGGRRRERPGHNPAGR
jgi:hypothetical protein